MKQTLNVILAAMLFLATAIRIDAATMYVVQYPTDGVNDANLQTALNNAVADANSELSVFNDQQGLARGFANANSFSSHSANFQGFQNYNIISASVGIMAGFQAPSLDLSYYSPDNVESDIRRDGDLDAGFAAGASVNIGLHARFITSGLYVNLKYGHVELGDEQDLFRYNNTVYGLGINYALSMPRTIVPVLLKWNGVSFGTGIIYQKNEITYQVELNSITQSVAGGGDIILNPTVNFAFDIATYTIPVEIVTSFRLFWLFNISAGAGIDFLMGTSDLIIKSVGTVDVTGTTLTQQGIVAVDGSTRDVNPSPYRVKLMSSLGFSIMMLKIEVPVIYYPSAGAAIGITAGVVF
ncbi:MAG TPA: hypothetical protein PKY31_13920 [Spirochaetota bacterium]|nr:hypothetical protein [Spirochaetota bacterium]